MKINDQSAFVKFKAHTQGPHDSSSLPAAATTDTQKGNTSTDKVVLSPKARELQEARARLEGLPDVDAQRVAQIQLQIENGTYKIDGGKIAERMLAEIQINSGL